MSPTTKVSGRKGKTLHFPTIAREAGVSDVTAYRVLKYKDRKPSWGLACKLADSMGWSLDQLRRHLEQERAA